MEEKLTPQQIKEVKALGFLNNRGTTRFSGRVITENGMLTSEQLQNLSEAARLFGNGNVAFTVRLTVEVPGIEYENIEAFRAYIANAGMVSGGTGAKVRPIVACKGTTCVFGLCDTQGIGTELHKRFFEGYKDVTLPHKFKIAVGGCPNNCAKPNLNDVGIVGYRRGKENEPGLVKIHIGGRWGKKTRMGDVLSRAFTREEAVDTVERLILLFKEYGNQGERFGETIDRMGIEQVEKILFSDELINNKEKTLNGVN